LKRLRQRDHRDIEGELRRHRPEPRPAFLAALSNDVHERMRRPKMGRRAALVTILTVGMLTVFATFGGIGYASSAADNAIHLSKIERLVGISQSTQSTVVPVNGTSSTGTDSAGDDEYRPGKGCGDPNHIHSDNDDCK
jgi:hypothetical protein